MKTSGQNQLKVSIVTFLMCVIQVNGIVLIITASTPYTYESTAVSLTCSIPAFTGGAEWIKGGVSLTQCQSSSCFPPNTGRYQYSATPTDITLAISSLDITQDETTWTCAHNAGADTGVHSLTVYKNLSAMSISGPTSSAVSNNVTVHLSVTTGCIHPSGSSYYTITWEYVEAGTTAGKLFGEETAKNFTSLGGCLNVNEDNLMLNLYFTNKINTGTTTLYISQIRMTFTMAGRNVSDSLNVTYNVTGSGKSTPSSTTTTTTTTVTSSSTSMSSATSNVTIDNTSTKPTTTGSSASTASSTSSNVTIGNISVNLTTNGSAASATNSTSTSVTPTAVSPANNTNNTSTLTNPTISGSTTTNKTTSNGSKSIVSDIDIKVIVPAVVVPCGLLIIGAIILLVVLYVRHTAGKNVHESPDGMAVQDKGNDAVYTTPDGFIIYPGPAAMSAARSYKDKKHHDVTDQYSKPYPGTYHHQSAYVPSTHTSARAYAHKDMKRHGVTDQYSRPSTGTYGYQAAYVPSTCTSARTYPHKGKNYDYEGPISQQASHQMAASRLVYDWTTYNPQTGYYGQNGEDVYYNGGGQYWQRSRSHHDHNGRKQQREYYNQYEMADYGGNRAGYRHTKQDVAFYY